MRGMKYRNVNISSVAALVLSLLAAAFFALGRAMFGVSGWFAFISVPAGLIVAVALVGLWSIPVGIVKEHPESGSYKASGWRESWAFIAVAVFLFLAGIFMVDSGDTDESVKSVFTQFVGRWALELSAALFWLCVLGVIASYMSVSSYLCVGLFLQVFVEAVGVGHSHLVDGLFPAGNPGSFDESASGSGGSFAFLGPPSSSFIFNIADHQPQRLQR